MILRSTRSRALVVVSAVVALLACIDDEPPQLGRVVVEASPTEPLLLIVSTNFLTVPDEDGTGREAVPLTADTVMITGDFDQEYSMARFYRLYVHLRNESATPETARLRVFLDGEVDHDAQRSLSDGDFIQYLFTSVIVQ